MAPAISKGMVKSYPDGHNMLQEAGVITWNHQVDGMGRFRPPEFPGHSGCYVGPSPSTWYIHEEAQKNVYLVEPSA